MLKHVDRMAKLEKLLALYILVEDRLPDQSRRCGNVENCIVDDGYVQSMFGIILDSLTTGQRFALIIQQLVACRSYLDISVWINDIILDVAWARLKLGPWTVVRATKRPHSNLD
jgi:hypothetical protein